MFSLMTINTNTTLRPNTSSQMLDISMLIGLSISKLLIITISKKTADKSKILSSPRRCSIL